MSAFRQSFQKPLRRALRRAFDAVSGGVPLAPEVVTYMTAVQAAGGTISGSQAQAFSTFVSSLKTAGIWTKLLDVGTFSGGTLASSAVKLKSLNGLNCTLSNFVLADLTASGLKSATTTKWANTQVPISILPGTGYCGLGVFVTEEVAPANFGTLIGASRGGNPQLCMSWYGTGDANGTIDALINGNGAQQSTMYNPLKKISVGLLHAERGSNINRMYAGGTLVSSRTSNFTYASSSDQIGIFGHGNGDLAMPLTVGLYFIDNGQITDAEAMVLAMAANRLMVGLGRIIPESKKFNYVPVIGQSLARGANGSPVVSTTQIYKNLATSAGVPLGNPADTLSLYLTGSIGAGNGSHPGALTGMVEQIEETSSGAANTLAKLSRDAGLGAVNDVCTANFAVGGTAYSGLAKGTLPYNNSIATVTALKAPAILYATDTLFVPAVWNMHGESDMNSLTYQADLTQWQADYETDLKAGTGQTGDIPMFCSQPSCWTATANINSSTGRAPYAIDAASRALPSKILNVGPKYFLSYSDGVHLANGAAYRLVWDYYGKADYQHCVQGIPWVPLRPLSISRSGAVIDVVLEGCVGNLVLDTTAVTDPSGASLTKGIEYRDDTIGDGPQRYTSIASVAILTQTPPTLRITLTADPGAATNKRLRYAFTGIPGNSAGPTTGPRGCVRDSDTRVGSSGVALVNWCIHFDESVA